MSNRTRSVVRAERTSGDGLPYRTIVDIHPGPPTSRSETPAMWARSHPSVRAAGVVLRYGHWMNPCAQRQPPHAGAWLPKQSSRFSSAMSQLLQVVQGAKSNASNRSRRSA